MRCKSSGIRLSMNLRNSNAAIQVDGSKINSDKYKEKKQRTIERMMLNVDKIVI